jgi:hypothetical protein
MVKKQKQEQEEIEMLNNPPPITKNEDLGTAGYELEIDKSPRIKDQIQNEEQQKEQQVQAFANNQLT